MAQGIIHSQRRLLRLVPLYYTANDPGAGHLLRFEEAKTNLMGECRGRV